MRLSARTLRLERAASALPDQDAFERGLVKMCRPLAELDDSPIEWEPNGLMKPRKRMPPMEPLTKAEAAALKAEGIDGLAGLLGWFMRQEDECD